MLALFAAGTVVGIRRISNIRIIRLVKNSMAPELTLASGMKWHIFNSRIWSTGQDAVAVIKNQLQQLLPGVAVFLDIDDLKDTGALEKYIECLQVILFFLSRGYFKSKNWLRQIRAALDQGKPIVLVQEADPAKGGGTLAELRAECPEELQVAVFDARWKLVVWHRIHEFQLLSLKMIAEAMLLKSPEYSLLAELSVYIPGELKLESLSLKNPVVLHASSANPGALALAKELQ